MAITRIHAIKATVDKTIAYICNPDKTDNKLLVSAFATSAQTAKYDFMYSLSKTNQSDKNQAFHLIQSFAPGEVSFDEAHSIGIELADKVLGGQYSYVIATHVDKDHVHNHICFCAANNITHKKYYDNKKSYYHIRELNDEICKEHHLSVIIPNAKRGKSYKEWMEDKKGTSWKSKLKYDIDETIKKGRTYEEFIALLKAKGYEIKGEELGNPNAKYISFKPVGAGRFIRGKDTTLGTEYTKERISERIRVNQRNLCKKKIPFPKHPQKIIDTNAKKFQESPGLMHWANVENLKIASQAYSNMESVTEYKKQIQCKNAIACEARSSVVKLEKELKSMGEILRYAKQYADNESYHNKYIKAKDKDAFYRKNDTQLVLFDGAENVLKANGIDVKKIDLVQMQKEYDSLTNRKVELLDTYNEAQKEVKEMQMELEKVERYLGREIERKQSLGKNRNDFGLE